VNLILENSKYTEYYTYLDQVFSSVPELLSLNWLITDLEYNFCTDSRLQTDPVIIDGKSLYEIIKKEKVQFIWAVFSGFKNKIENCSENLPFANGNPEFWKGSPTLQAEGAEIEIVCWDSTLTLFIGSNNNVTKKLKVLYPDIKNLDHENEARG